MGREMIFEVRENGKVIWPNPDNIDDALYVCGRDDATTFLASYVNNSLPEDANDDTEPVFLIRFRDDSYTFIKERLQEFYDKDLAEIKKAKDTLEDLREARKHANYEDFFKFSESMEETQNWLDENAGWSRAGSLLDYLQQCYNKMVDYINQDDNPDREAVFDKYRVAIIWSE